MNARSATSNAVDLPPGYRLQTTIDLKKDTKVSVSIQFVFVLIVAVVIGLAVVLDIPVGGGWSAGVKIPVTVAACVIYMVVHELSHGIVLKLISKLNPTYSLRFPYLTTGSEAYLNKRSGVAVALAPAAYWGIVLVAMLFIVPTDFFLTVYIVTTLNFAGSAGDYFQASVISKLPPTALIRDNGKETTVFLPGV